MRAKAWCYGDEGPRVLVGESTRVLEARADRLGAIRLELHGEILRKIDGEWVYICETYEAIPPVPTRDDIRMLSKWIDPPDGHGQGDYGRRMLEVLDALLANVAEALSGSDGASQDEVHRRRDALLSACGKEVSR